MARYKHRNDDYVPPPLEERLYDEVRYMDDNPRNIAFALLPVIERLLREADPKDEIADSYKRGVEDGTANEKYRIKKALGEVEQ
jgi:hypothetical protein